MKKYITVAALLAAGTAFAHAETIVDVVTIESNKANWVIEESTSLANYWAVQFELSSIPHGSILNLNSDIVVKGQNDGINAYLGLGITGEDDTHWISDSGGTSTKMNSIFPDKNITVVCRDGEISIWVGETQQYTRFYSNTTGLSYATSLDYSAKTDIKSLTSGFAVDSAVEWVKVASFDSTTSASSVVAAMSATPIPEPSAFGLLAGLGALALVASRRRRK